MRNYKKITAILFTLFLAVIFLLPETVFAQEVWGMDQLTELNLGTQSLEQIIAGIINIALGFLGIIAIGIMLYGGFLWMTSGGNAEKVDKAKKALLNGFIGLVIITSAYAIARFLLDDAMDIINNTGGGGGNGNYNAPTNGLGAEVLDSHYPTINAQNVPRNTNIYVTFTEDMNTDTIGTNCNVGPDETVCGAAAAGITLWDDNNSIVIEGTDLRVTYRNGQTRTFEINPYGAANQHLGDDAEIYKYVVELANVQTANSQPAFRGANEYRWAFYTSTELDTEAPSVVSVFPAEGATGVPLNSVVQINFSEPVNPIFAVGKVILPFDIADDFHNITLTAGAPVNTVLGGEYKSTNQYRTVEFLTTNDCGENSCGERMYCLPEGDPPPSNYQIDGLVTTAIEDMAGNNMVNNKTWFFGVVNEIDTDPPVMISMDATTNVAIDAPIQVVFNNDLMTGSINGQTVSLQRIDPISGALQNINYWAERSNPSNLPLNDQSILIHHGNLTPNTTYVPTLRSGIKNTTQNCWQPCNCSGPSCRCSNDPLWPPQTDCPGPNCVGNCSGPSCTGSEI